MASSGSNQNQAFQATAVVTQGKYLLLIIINLYLPIKGVLFFLFNANTPYLLFAYKISI